MADKQLMERAEQALYKVYNRFPVVFDHGEGVKLYDTEGNEYLDFGAGIAVMALGYGDEEYTKAVEEQLHKLTHISNLFYNQPSIEAGEKLLQVSHMDKVFFTNSGTEAIEGALKIAKRYHYNKLHETMGDGCDGCEDAEPDMTGEIIAMNHSFHGRSLGALAVTGNAHYQEPFKPLIPGIRFADFNDLDSVKKLINSKTCAVIMETIQGEGGIYPATEEFLKGVRGNVCLAALRREAGRDDSGLGAGKRASHRCLPGMGQGGQRHGSGRPRHHLWRQSAGDGGSRRSA